MKKLTVSIGIPAYNEQHNIGILLKQLLAQKQKGFIIEKIIIASDGSTDKTTRIAQKYAKHGVEIIEGKENRGQTYRQNEIIARVSSDILVLLNADLLLKGDEVIFGLIVPLRRGADLSAQWAKPIPSRTFLGKILSAGFDLKYYIYTHYEKGNNIYTCVGHMRALSRKLYSNITFPIISFGEDQYLYLACVSMGYQYKHVDANNLYFKLPDQFGDYKHYAKRIFKTQKKYKDVFNEQLIRKERTVPLKLQFRGSLYALSRDPLYAVLYIVLHAIMQRWSLMQPETTEHAFETAKSTKLLTANS